MVWNRIDYLYKMDLALNNLQMFICHKPESTNQHLGDEYRIKQALVKQLLLTGIQIFEKIGIEWMKNKMSRIFCGLGSVKNHLGNLVSWKQIF